MCLQQSQPCMKRSSDDHDRCGSIPYHEERPGDFRMDAEHASLVMPAKR